MKIIHNKWIPFGRGMYAINLFGIIFTKQHLTRIDVNHEYIHTLQQRELLFVFFFLLYVTEWIVRVIQTRSLIKGYLRISFEREAYENQRQLDYRETRKFFAWRKYL
jgi:hypothetical protein